MSSQSSRHSVSIAFLLAASIVFQTIPLMNTAVFAQKRKPAQGAPINSQQPQPPVDTAAPQPIVTEKSSAPLAGTPTIVAAKVDAWDDSATPDGKAEPGQTITYTVTIQNTGTGDATGVTFTDSVDTNTTLVPGSITTQPIASADAFNVIGNVRIQVPDGASDLMANDCDPDPAGGPCTNAGLTITTLAGDSSAPFAGLSTAGGNVTATTGDGSFQYNPAAGFAGQDTFTYTVTDGSGKTDTATVTLNVGNGTASPGANVIWFINPAAAAGGDGRLTSPFNCFRGTTVPVTGPTCFSDTAADDPGDAIFLFSGAHTSGYTLLNNQKLVGAGAMATLASIAGVTVQTYSDALPATGQPSPTLTSGSITDSIALGTGNTIRGLTFGNSGTATGNASDINGNNFGTLTILDVTLNGSGRALNLVTGTLAAGSTIDALTVTQSTGGGVNLDAVSGSLTVGATSIDNQTSGQSSIRINSSSGNFTFGTTNLDRRGSAGININAASGAIQFGAVTINNQSSSATSAIAVDNTTGTGSVTVSSATIDNNNVNAVGIALSGNSGTISINGGSVTNIGATGTGIQVSSAGNAAVTVAANVTNTAGRSVQVLNRNGGTTTLSGNINDAGTGINVANNTGGTVTFSGATKTINTGANQAVTLNTNAGTTINFSNGGLGITTTSGTGFNASGGGTISVSTGANNNTISSGSGGAIIANGVALNATFTSVSATGGTNGIGLTNVTGTSNFGNGSLTGASAAEFLVSGSNPTVTYGGTITQNAASQRAISVAGITGGTETFSGAIGSNGGSGVSFEGTGGVVTISGAMTFIGTNSVFKACSGTCAAPSGSGLTINVTNTNNTIGTTTAATTTGIQISNAVIGASGVQFKTVNVSGGTNGIVLANTGNSGGSFQIVGTGTDNSGGLITGVSGDGISLNTTRNVTLTEMQINNSGQSAIDATSVTNLTLSNTDFDSSSDHGFNGNTVTNLTISGGVFNRGGANAEPTCNFDGFNITNLLGTNSITSATFTRSNTRQFRVNNTINGGSQDTLTVTATNWNTHTGPCAGDHLSLNADGSANLKLVMNASMNKNVVSTGGTGVQVTAGGGSGNMAADITGLQTSGNTAGVVVAASGTSNIAFNVHGNKASANSTGFSGTGSVGLILTCTTSGTCQGQFDDNTITHTAGTSTNAMQVVVEGNGTGKVTVSNNVVSGNFQRGLQAQQRGGTGSGSLALQVTNNSFTQTDAGGLQVMNFESSFSGDTTTVNTMCVNLANNTATPAGANLAYRFFNRLNDVFQLQNYPTAPCANGNVPCWVNTTKSNLPNNNALVGASGAVAYTGSAGCATAVLPAASTGIADTKVRAHAAILTAAAERSDDTALDAPHERVLKSIQSAVKAGALQSASRNSARNSKREIPSPKSHHAKSSRALRPVLGAGGTVSINIGTLAPGDSVTITFQVTIDNPYSGGPNVSNQGTVSGSNFSNVLTNDPDTVAANDATLTPINAIKISVNDAKQAEPTSGTSNMVFTVALSAPANGAVSVNFTTADQAPGAGHAVAGTCGAGGDYTATSGTVNFAVGQQVKTINVPVCSDAVSEPDETFLVNLSSPSGGNILDGTATGTITAANPPGTLVISEFRTRGSGGANDDFVELYNNTNSPIVVPAGGYGVFKMGATCGDTPVLVGTIPATTSILARGHFLLTGSSYSLANYGGTNAALGNASLTADIEDDRNIALFSTTDVTAISSTKLLDAVGFGTNTGNVCDLTREGSTVAPVGAINLEYSYFRTEKSDSSGNPKDTNNNSADFKFADTAGTFIAGVTQALGAPGPENLASPIRRDTSGIGVVVLDSTVSSTIVPNRARDLTSDPGNNSAFGTLRVRRRVVNNTGQAVMRLRFRVVDITTFPSPGGGVADLRARTSASEPSVGPVNDATTCTASGAGSPPCTVTTNGLTLEMPPNQTLGGGYNSTLTVNLGSPLANGASLNVNFLLGVQTTGTFRFLIIVEALP
jgi:Bacterial Ig domain/Calx-beta domain